MNKSKKVFLGLAVVFLVAMVIIGIDISSRTTFPGSKKNLQERILNRDSTQNDASTNSLSEPSK